MKLEKLQFVEITGVLAVVLSLLFVAYEIRQSNRIAIATMEYEIRDNYSSINELILSNEGVAELLYKWKDPSFEISGIEREQADEFVARFANIWAAVESAYTQGLLPEASYIELLDEDIRAVVFQYPALHFLWTEELNIYSSQNESDRHIALRKYMNEYSENNF